MSGALSSLEKRWLQGGPNSIPQCLQGDYQGARARLFVVMHGEKRDNKDKWKQKRLRLGKEKHFTMRPTKQQNMLPREVMQSLSLEVFKTQLDKSLSNLVCPS